MGLVEGSSDGSRSSRHPSHHPSHNPSHRSGSSLRVFAQIAAVAEGARSGRLGASCLPGRVKGTENRPESSARVMYTGRGGNRRARLMRAEKGKGYREAKNG